MSIISVERLTKDYRVHERRAGLGAALRSLVRRRYEVKRAVDELSFAIAPGERVGFLGPNGAGKTTTLKMLAGLLHPTSGRVEVAGHVPQRREVSFLQQITLVMGQKQQLLWDLPPSDTFQLNRAVYDVPRAAFEETLGELDRLLDLSRISRVPTRQLSLGERMKCELAAALLHRPKVLFLDEPTIGLDVSMQVSLRAFIRRYNERFGATVLLTSHYMDDVAALCPRVIVIDKGALRYDGDLQGLVRSIRPDKRVTLRLARDGGGPMASAMASPTEGPASSPAGDPTASPGAGPVEGPSEVSGAAPEERRAALEATLSRVGKLLSFDGTQAQLQVAQVELRAAVSHLLGALPVVDLSVEDPPLEEVMRDLFEGAPRPAP